MIPGFEAAKGIADSKIVQGISKSVKDAKKDKDRKQIEDLMTQYGYNKKEAKEVGDSVVKSRENKEKVKKENKDQMKKYRDDFKKNFMF